jgi:hypothetical protein
MAMHLLTRPLQFTEAQQVPRTSSFLRPGDGKRWTKPLRGRFNEVSIGNCQRRVRQRATRLNTTAYDQELGRGSSLLRAGWAS